MELTPISDEHFKDCLYDMCLQRIVEAIKGIESLMYIKADRHLQDYELGNLTSFRSQLRTNENWILIADPTYSRIQ